MKEKKKKKLDRMSVLYFLFTTDKRLTQEAGNEIFMDILGR